MTAFLLDAGLVGLVLVHGLFGIRRGFVPGVLDFLASLGTVWLALLAISPVAQLIEGLTHLPPGITALAAALLILPAGLALFTLLTLYVYRSAFAPHLNGNARSANALLGLIPGAINGVIVAAILLELLSLIPVNGAFNNAMANTRFARPLALAAEKVGSPFAQMVQDAALDVNGLLTRRFGEPSTRVMPLVTDMAADAAAEKRMLDLVNAERTQIGLAPLVLDTKLTQIARQHSQEMLEQHYFAHESPLSGSPFDRMARASIRYRVAGENLALAANVERAHTGLMNSPEHRDNILRPEFRKVGIGAVNGGLAGEMFTQDFTD